MNPAALEVCNGLDDDCDTLTDDADDSLDLSSAGVYYSDLDTDGYGDADAHGYAGPTHGYPDACAHGHADPHPHGHRYSDAHADTARQHLAHLHHERRPRR